jgi:hypothetical protein
VNKTELETLNQIEILEHDYDVLFERADEIAQEIAQLRKSLDPPLIPSKRRTPR